MAQVLQDVYPSHPYLWVFQMHENYEIKEQWNGLIIKKPNIIG
jgi:hypothetical protein